jgi:ribonuclease R
VNDLFEHGKASEFYGKYREVYGALEKMRELYLILAERDRRRGILELETAEPIITLGEDGEPTDIRAAERGEAEKLIEAFMLTANRAVAEHLHARGIPCVYRVHEAPPPEKYESLCDYLASLSLPFPWKPGESGSAAALRHLIEKAAERELATPVSMTVLRSMAKARYSAAPEPHFGLALELYCHFTSPIRRLSDLVTHRILKAALFDGAAPGKHRAAARRGADAATNGELRALTAERRIEALYKTLYMKQHLGETFTGRVSSVTSHGVYVELPNTCEGLVPLSLLDGDYTFDEHRRTLTRGLATIAIGDEMTVTVRDADVTTGKITFSLAG